MRACVFISFKFPERFNLSIDASAISAANQRLAGPQLSSMQSIRNLNGRFLTNKNGVFRRYGAVGFVRRGTKAIPGERCGSGAALMIPDIAVNPAPNISARLAPWSETPPCAVSSKITATIDTPIDWPSSRDMVLIPPAPPLRSLGALATMARLLGAPKMPNPAPPSAARHKICHMCGCSPTSASSISPPVISGHSDRAEHADGNSVGEAARIVRRDSSRHGPRTQQQPRLTCENSSRR